MGPNPLSRGPLPVTLSNQVKYLFEQIVDTCMTTKIVLLFIMEMILTVLYLGLAVDIIAKLLRKHRRYSNNSFLVNRAIMKKYRSSLLM